MKQASIELVTPEMVIEACRILGIDNWYRDPVIEDLVSITVTHNDAVAIMTALEISKQDIPIEIMVYGLQVELEHGSQNPYTNITNNHPLVTALIVMAHHHESPLYYPKLAIMEKELKLYNYMSDMYEALDGKVDINALRMAIQNFNEIENEERTSLNATEIAIGRLLL